MEDRIRLTEIGPNGIKINYVVPEKETDQLREIIPETEIEIEHDTEDN